MEEALVQQFSGILAPGPVVTKQLFSVLSGLSEDTVRGMIERGHLPTVKIGKHRLVNLALVAQSALQSEFD